MSLCAVTGATGFVGRRLTAALGESVRVLSRSPGAAAESLGVDARLWAPGYGGLERSLEGVSAVVHLAAYIPSDLSSPDQLHECLRVNVEGTQEILQAAVSAGIRKIIVFSSGNIYRQKRDAVAEEESAYPSRRASYYLASKVCADVIADHVNQIGGGDVVIMRPSSIYGPGMQAKGLIPTLASRLLLGQTVTLKDAGRYGADFVYVDDVVAATVAALRGPVRGPYNIGSGLRVSALEVAEILVAILGVSKELVEAEPASGGEETGFPALDVSRARRDLGLEPRSLRAGLEDYVRALAGRP